LSKTFLTFNVGVVNVVVAVLELLITVDAANAF
jgi:hypothetical protein